MRANVTLVEEITYNNSTIIYRHFTLKADYKHTDTHTDN